MGTMRYREIDWDHLDVPLKKPPFSSEEFVVWIIVLLLFIAALLFFLPVRDLLLSPAGLAAKYPRSPAWLNRCDASCAADVDISYLSQQRRCSALTALFTDGQHADVFSWRLAIDDRASALGCSGFPKALSFIRASVRQDAAGNAAEIEKTRWEKEQQMLDAQAQEVQRYEQSIAQGKLDTLVIRVAQSIRDPGEMLVTVSPAWQKLAEDERQQVTQVIWQKWAVIHSLLTPEQSTVVLLDEQGNRL